MRRNAIFHPKKARMSKKILRDDQLVFRAARPLREALDQQAAAESLDLSDVIRRALVDQSARWLVDRAKSEGVSQ
jgi:hypothetical protein